MPKKKTFLDTNLLIAASRGEEKLSKIALELINDPQREFVASDFLRLELIPKPTWRGNNDELDFYNAYLEDVEMVDTTSDLMQQAELEACQFGLSAIDALHVTAAALVGAELISGEKETKPLYRVTCTTVTPLLKIDDEPAT